MRIQNTSGVSSNTSESHGAGSSLLGLLTFKWKTCCADAQVSRSSGLIFQLAAGRGFTGTNMEGVILLIVTRNSASPLPMRVGFVLAHNLSQQEIPEVGGSGTFMETGKAVPARVGCSPEAGSRAQL